MSVQKYGIFVEIPGYEKHGMAINYVLFIAYFELFIYVLISLGSFKMLTLFY